MRVLLAAAVLVLALAPAAHAEMFRCVGPDGNTLYTSDRSKCPSAAPHRSSGRIHRSTGRTEPRAQPKPTALSPARRAAIEEEAEAQVWRAKRANAQAELQRARRELETLHEVAGWCNRGHEVWATDRDGLKRGVDCKDVKRQEQTLRQATEQLEHYLDEGLEDECRRSGCLPGWIRE